MELLRREGEDGRRRVLAFGGDTMLGRRYVEPADGPALVQLGDDGASARAVVSDIVQIFGDADLSMLNLETVVGELDLEDAYPGKRWLLLTPPEGLAAVDALGTDLVVLANNHQRDWLEPGQGETLDALERASLAQVGGGRTAAEAADAAVVTLGRTTVGVLAYTSVDGAYVNDRYPDDAEAEPADVAASDAWLWEFRHWGWPDAGIPYADRRVGGAWRALVPAEQALERESDRAALWESARSVYPELQDWVAGRGHGGASPWQGGSSTEAIAALAAVVDLVVVQLHMGFQYAPVSSAGLRAAAESAVAAGADIVVGHHPHVLQGIAWVEGHLVAHSLGNLVFDQDFRATWDSMVLRTTWSESGELERARLVPLFIDGYRPVPSVDERAVRTLRTIWSRSLLDAEAQRGNDGWVRTVIGERAVAEGAPGFELEHGTARLTAEPTPAVRRVVELRGSASVRAPDGGAVAFRLSDDPPAGVETGRALFGLGSFEDLDVDSEGAFPTGWTWASADVTLVESAGRGGAPPTRSALQLVRGPDDAGAAYARATARVALGAHRLFEDADGRSPADPGSRYSVRLDAWASGEGDLGRVRLDLYHFDDTDPTRPPETTALRAVDLPFEANDIAWRTLDLDLPADLLDPVDGLLPNAALLSVRLEAPAVHTTVLRVDEVEVIEWRPAVDEPAGYGEVDYIRARKGDSGPVSVELLPW